MLGHNGQLHQRSYSSRPLRLPAALPIWGILDVPRLVPRLVQDLRRPLGPTFRGAAGLSNELPNIIDLKKRWRIQGRYTCMQLHVHNDIFFSYHPSKHCNLCQVPPSLPPPSPPPPSQAMIPLPLPPPPPPSPSHDQVFYNIHVHVQVRGFPSLHLYM